MSDTSHLPPPELSALLRERAPEIEAARRLPDDVASVLLVGHNPSLQALTLWLAGGGDGTALARAAVKFPTGALAPLVVS